MDPNWSQNEDVGPVLRILDFTPLKGFEYPNENVSKIWEHFDLENKRK